MEGMGTCEVFVLVFSFDSLEIGDERRLADYHIILNSAGKL